VFCIFGVKNDTLPPLALNKLPVPAFAAELANWAPAVPTPNPPAEPVDKAFDALFGPGSIDATQSEATTDARDRKQQIQDRLKLLRERLSELPSPPSIQPSYAPVSPRISKADKDTAAQRRMILKAIKKSEAELKKL